jgi:hypothetical protein
MSPTIGDLEKVMLIERSLSRQCDYLLNSVGAEADLCEQRKILEAGFAVAAKTAISRSSPSAPLKVLLSKGLIGGKVCNFGKGRSDFDSAAIAAVALSVADYDFVHAPFESVLDCQYDSVYAGYVLNVLEPEARLLTLKMIARITATTGKAFIAVRSDTETALKSLYLSGTAVKDGVRSNTGTFQKGFNACELLAYVKREFAHARLISKAGGFVLIEARNAFVQ